MPIIEIITIGTELLLGDIQDTNTRFLTRSLRDHGVDIYRTMMIGDNPARITLAVQEALGRSDVVLTTGGLGPTVDDPTRQAVADALAVPLEYHPELWEQIILRFKRYGRSPSENNRRQAYVPQGAKIIPNPVGTAPSFICETPDGKSVISLPGVPREMEYLYQNEVLPYLQSRFELNSTLQTCVLHAASIGESRVDELIADLETLSNPTVGLLAHPGQTDIRVAAKAATREDALALIAPVVADIRSRLGQAIFGQDDETLEAITANVIKESGFTCAILEAGLGGQLISLLARTAGAPIRSDIRSTLDSPAILTSEVARFKEITGSQMALGVNLQPGQSQQNLTLHLVTPHGVYEDNRSYDGPPEYGPMWAARSGLDFIRTHIKKEREN